MANITNLPVTGPIKLGGEKVIALTQMNIDAIKKSYNSDSKVIAAQTSGSNKDLLSQSFGGGEVQSNAQISINDEQKSNSDLESTAVNLTMESNNEPLFDASKFEIPSMPSNTTLDVTNSVQNPTVESKPEMTASPINSEFKVSDAPNIFDVPQMDVNFQNQTVTTSEINNSPVQENIFNIPETNIFATSTNSSIEEVKSSDTKVGETTVKENEENVSLNNDILEARIAIEKSNYDLYMRLAENSKKMAELLEKQIKTNDKKEVNNLENTASNLFNNNGALDTEKVFGFKVA